MHFAEYKTILSANNNMNIYRGCTHACIYCDSRSTCYQFKHAFEDIEVKQGATLILDQELSRKRTVAMLSTGAMSDPYIHLESKLRQTRACLEVIYKHGFGLSIQTKSDRILEDLDLLVAIHKRAKCVVEMTLTTFDEDLCRILEPQVSTTNERFLALKVLQDAGIPTVVWLTPILPFINDSDENLLGILEYCKDASVFGIINFDFGMTLRDGNREYFYEKLDLHFPAMKELYIKTFGNQYQCLSPRHNELKAIFESYCLEHGILYQIDDIFHYLKTLDQPRQISFFD